MPAGASRRASGAPPVTAHSSCYAARIHQRELLYADAMRLLQFLFRYNQWADLLHARCVAPQLTNDQFTRDLGSSFGSVRDTLAHLYGAEWLWNERFQGRSPAGLPPASAYPDLAAVRAKLDEMDRNCVDYVSQLTQQDLERVIRYKTVAGTGFRIRCVRPAPTLQSRHISPRPGSHVVAAVGRETGFHGFDRFLSRASCARKRLSIRILPKRYIIRCGVNLEIP